MKLFQNKYWTQKWIPQELLTVTNMGGITSLGQYFLSQPSNLLFTGGIPSGFQIEAPVNQKALLSRREL